MIARLAGAALGVAGALALSGCTVVAATAKTATAVAATTVTTAGKVTVATVKTSGKVVTSAVSSSGDVTALSLESAAKLARAGMVVSVDASTGAVTETPWREGLRLYSLVQSAKAARVAEVAAIFRGDRRMEFDLRRVRRGLADCVLQSGDVVEFRRREAD